MSYLFGTYKPAPGQTIFLTDLRHIWIFRQIRTSSIVLALKDRRKSASVLVFLLNAKISFAMQIGRTPHATQTAFILLSSAKNKYQAGYCRSTLLMARIWLNARETPVHGSLID